MLKKSILVQSMLVALIAPQAALAEVEATVELRNETAFYTKSGQTIGQPATMLDTFHDNSAGDMMKFQNQAKVFLNGDIGESSSWHGELQIIYDASATNDEDSGGVNYKGHEEYTQNDFLRELYVDTEAGGWDLRLGKQQVVWGTADGIKLLDIINPTDFREVNQNVTEDARIPIWMINAEKNIGDNSNIQLIVSQREENKIPGLNPGGDEGHPFVMKGVDTISGQVNGFYNIAPKLSNVAASFNMAAAGGAFGVSPPSGLLLFAGLTVDGFASGPGLGTTGTGYGDLNAIAQYGLYPGDPNGNYNVTALMNITGPNADAFGVPNDDDVTWSVSNPKSAFEYMSNASFATFNTFTQCFDGDGGGCDNIGVTDAVAGITTEWVRDYDDEPNAGFRFKSYLNNGLNYSLNYFYHYSSNPDINLSWRDASGAELTSQLAPTAWIDAGVDGPTPDDTYYPDASTTLSRTAATAELFPVNVLLHDGTGSTYYGAFDPLDPFGGSAGAGGHSLRFTETSHRVHSLGGSFDYALETELPVVIRGEFLYDKDDKQAVVDRYLLGVGDLTNALTMQDADYFKYVIGVDVTVMTNLLVSGQFIQFRNLDYIDQSATCSNGADCSVYTGDLSTLHLSNGMMKAEENKEFYSLFFSKPIGVDQLGRWNNITIYEENGGWWNRLDAEYSLSDQFIVSAEWNNYWGDEDTTFGQLDKSSNVQVGFRYIFEDY